MAVALTDRKSAMFASLPRIIVVSVALLSVLEPLQARKPPPVGANDFAFLGPWFHLEQKDRDTLTQRGVVVQGLPASNKQISIAATCAVDISADELSARVNAIGTVARGDLVTGRFSEPPTLNDLSPLTLDQGDVDRIRACRPGACALNLADHEMSDLQRALRHPEAPTDVQNAFRRVLLSRLARYQSGGLAALPEYHDRRDPVQPAAVLSAIRQQIPYLQDHLPAVAAYMERFPFTDTTGTATSARWSKMIVNNKAVVAISHLATFLPEPGPWVPTVVTVATTIYASRYMDGELTLWMLFASGDPSSSYLVYVTRSELDTLGGTFSRLKRSAIEGRMKEAAGAALESFCDRRERQP
jgi:hypothetical protein